MEEKSKTKSNAGKSAKERYPMNITFYEVPAPDHVKAEFWRLIYKHLERIFAELRAEQELNETKGGEKDVDTV